MIDKALTTEMMAFVVKTIGYDLPNALPPIEIEADMEMPGRFDFEDFGAVIVLKEWNPEDLFHQAVLVHELAHWVQYWNDVDLQSVVFGRDSSEVEAVTAECRWIQSKGENPSDYLSEEGIFQMTGDAEFSTLRWLEVEMAA